MKLLQNKETGDIGCLVCSFGKTPEKITVVEYVDGKRGGRVWYYDSLAGLDKDWEDYEEPKEYWYIDDAGVEQIDQVLSSEINMRKSIGNYFSSREEAELAVRKLNAWQRLKDKGFRFDGYNSITRSIDYDVDSNEDVREELYTLFGGEE